MRCVSRLIFSSYNLNNNCTNLPTTAFLASISYHVEDNWSFLTNFVIVRGLILLTTIKSN